MRSAQGLDALQVAVNRPGPPSRGEPLGQVTQDDRLAGAMPVVVSFSHARSRSFKRTASGTLTPFEPAVARRSVSLLGQAWLHQLRWASRADRDHAPRAGRPQALGAVVRLRSVAVRIFEPMRALLLLLLSAAFLATACQPAGAPAPPTTAPTPAPTAAKPAAPTAAPTTAATTQP